MGNDRISNPLLQRKFASTITTIVFGRTKYSAAGYATCTAEYSTNNNTAPEKCGRRKK